MFEPPIALPRIAIAQFWHERYHRDAGHRWLRNVTFQLFGRSARQRSSTAWYSPPEYRPLIALRKVPRDVMIILDGL